MTFILFNEDGQRIRSFASWLFRNVHTRKKYIKRSFHLVWQKLMIKKIKEEIKGIYDDNNTEQKNYLIDVLKSFDNKLITFNFKNEKGEMIQTISGTRSNFSTRNINLNDLECIIKKSGIKHKHICRTFKVSIRDAEYQGRYKSIWPSQAAKKAYSKLVKNANGVVKICIKECTRNSKQKIYYYDCFSVNINKKVIMNGKEVYFKKEIRAKKSTLF